MSVSNAHPSPGVYTNIKDLSARVQSATITSSAFVGRSVRGPVMERTLITDLQNYRDNFGLSSPKFGFMRYCVEPYLQKSNLAYVTRVINGALWAGAYWTVDDPDAVDPKTALVSFSEDGSNVPMGRDDPQNTMGFSPSDAGIDNVLGFFSAIDPGAWNNNIHIQISPANPKGIELRGNGHNPLKFYVKVFYGQLGESAALVETHTCMRHDETDELGTQMNIEEVINNNSSIIRFKANPYCKEFDIVVPCAEKLNGGSDGLAPTNDQIAQAWEIYEDTDAVNVDLLVNCGYTSYDVQVKMEAVARSRGDAIAILDLPANAQSPALAVNYKRNILNISSYHAAIYGPRVKYKDADLNLELWIPVSGVVAARYAYNDEVRALWFAPAGVTRGYISDTVYEVEEFYNQGDRDVLDKAQVNYIRSIPNKGLNIWSQYTTQEETTSMQNVNVARLTFHILKSAAKAAQYRLFDPNDSLLRAYIVQISDDFMYNIKANRGVYDYVNICDERNNNATTIANGDLVLDMIYDPTIAVKRVHHIFNINKTGSTLTVES